MSRRIAQRLSAAREEWFVGREAEQNLFASAIAAPHPPFNVLFVHGPGGIGKTNLLRAFERICAAHGTAAVTLDARHLEPTPDAFLSALGDALSLNPPLYVLDRFDSIPDRTAILLDTYEVLAPLDGWLRESFLPALPDRTLMVFAGRDPPRSAWRVDPGWQSLVHVMSLGNLTTKESLRYLMGRGIPEEAWQGALQFTHGHPLALSVIADVLRQRPQMEMQPLNVPDVIRVLLQQFLNDIPGPQHRAALEAAALLRVTNEALLCQALEVSDAHDIFEWLRDLSFIEAGPFGLFPHDLARDALTADLRWRDPDRYRQLHGRARAYYAERLPQTRGQEQQRILSDYVYLHRDNPVLRPFIDWQETGTAVPESVTPADLPAVLEMVRRHEGEESADLARFWLERRPGQVLVIRAQVREPAGVLMLLPLDELLPEERERDPAIRAACDYLERQAPLRAGEVATHFRFWLSGDAYQSTSAVQSLIFLKIAQHYLATPRLAFSFFPVADAAFWEPFCAYIDLFAVPEAAFTVGDHRYEVFGHDWRVVPPTVWLDLLAERELDDSPPLPSAPPAERRSAGLTEGEFVAAVHAALRNFTRPRELRSNPLLLRSRLLSVSAGAASDEMKRLWRLQALLRRAAETLRESPRQARYYDALHHAYFHPASSQEQAARLLYVSFSTFRRHLRAGVEQVGAILWDWELHGGEPHDSASRDRAAPMSKPDTS